MERVEMIMEVGELDGGRGGGSEDRKGNNGGGMEWEEEVVEERVEIGKEIMGGRGNEGENGGGWYNK